MAKSRPTPVRNVAVTLNGVTHKGTYYVQDLMLRVSSVAGEKTTQVAGPPRESIAKLLLLELARDERKRH
jgi:hypothetical protein